MIVFGCSIVAPDVYGRCAGRGIARAAEPGSIVFAHAASASVARSYNLLLDRAATQPELEALVILHQDAELLDRDFCARLRRVFADPQVAVVGCIGAIGAGNSIAWWDGSALYGSLTYRQRNPDREVSFGPGLVAPTGVDTVYGVLLALSPWAVENLRCDESIGLLNGYDADLCRQARAAGRKVLAADLGVAHHHSFDLVSEIETWVAAHMRAADAWEADALAEDDIEWKSRARRAEADAAAARLRAASKLLALDASVERDRRELDELRTTRSWRITEPLRRGNAIVRDARERLKGH